MVCINSDSDPGASSRLEQHVVYVAAAKNNPSVALILSLTHFNAFVVAQLNEINF